MEVRNEKLEEWEEVEEEMEDATYLKWEKENTQLIGTLKEIFESKTGVWYGKIDTGEKLLTMFSLPSILMGKLRGMEGKTLRIVYIGPTKFKSGKTGKDFKVYAKKEGT